VSSVIVNQNIDLIYDQSPGILKLLREKNFQVSVFAVDSFHLYKEWNNFSLKFNLENQMLKFTVNGKLAGSSSNPDKLQVF